MKLNDEYEDQKREALLVCIADLDRDPQEILERLCAAYLDLRAETEFQRRLEVKTHKWDTLADELCQLDVTVQKIRASLGTIREMAHEHDQLIFEHEHSAEYLRDKRLELEFERREDERLHRSNP